MFTLRWSHTATHRIVRGLGVEIRVLGPLEVVVDGRPVELPSAKARLVLAALARFDAAPANPI
jgi:hypothetical protein